MTPARRWPAPWWLLPFAAVPLAWVLNFYAYVLRARHMLGRWPRIPDPDPVAADYYAWHQNSIFLGVLVVAAALAFGSLLFMIFANLRRYRYPWFPLLIFVFGASSCALVTFADPGGFWNWYLYLIFD